jgi:hypothetical protein
MTVLHTESTLNVLTASPVTNFLAGAGIVLIVLLSGLLIAKEAIRASGIPHVSIWMQTLDVAILPLSLAFAIFAFLRMASLLYPPQL